MSRHLPVLLLLLSFPAFVAAQDLTNAEAEAEKARDKQALEVLESIAEAIPGLRASENRIYLTSAVADLLWSKDEKRARALFDVVTKEVISLVTAFDQAEQQQNDNMGMIQQQRQEIIERMARHDPEMAMTFLRVTRFPAESSSGKSNQLTNDRQLELNLAGLIAAKDPAQALRIARASVRKGLPYGVINLIHQIDATDRSTAQALHREIVDQLKNEDLTRNHEAANSAWNLLSSYQPPQAKEETYRDLLEHLAGVVLSVTPTNSDRTSFANNQYGYVQSMMSQMEKYAPGRVPALRQWLQNVRPKLDQGTRIYQEINEAVQKGTVDDVVTLAGKQPAEFRAHAYQQAAWKALSSGDANRSRQIISEFISDPAQRRQMLDQLDNQLLWNTVQQNKIEEAHRMLGRVKNVEQRVQLLISMAGNVASRGEKKQALELLGEARTMLDSSPPDSRTLSAQLQLAQSYISLDSEQGVALIESIITQVNQLVAAAVVLDGFEHRYLREGEWMRAAYSTLGNLINTLDQNLGQLAQRDPERARYLSTRLERLEIRLIAQLEIAQALLAKMVESPPRRIGRRYVRFNN
ncbi:MAG: hypothetical protein ACREBG_13200 [Pyrinomonadaceae bacterium]